MSYKKFGGIIFAVMWLLSAAAYAGPISEIEINSEPEKDGQRDFSVRFMPGKTHQCDDIVFECVYRQQFPWENLQGKKYTKIYEPVSFTYYSHNVRMVADLDKYISFRVPMSIERLKKAYGEKTFNEKYPVTVGHIKIKALRGKEVIWSYDLEAGGVFKGSDLKELKDKK